MREPMQSAHEVIRQYDFVTAAGGGGKTRGVVLNPQDLESLEKRGQLQQSANKTDKRGKVIMGFLVSSSSVVEPNHALWIGDDYRVILYTCANGPVEKTYGDVAFHIEFEDEEETA